ncbi:MAG: hypothetical protein J5651_00370 [Salinivirgaceae bacterium]|nr:hypothetical protein [Salinivirgaceae bacterium]
MTAEQVIAKTEQVIVKVKQILDLENLASVNNRYYVDSDHTQCVSNYVAEIFRNALKAEADRLRKEFADEALAGMKERHADCCAACSRWNIPEYCAHCRACTDSEHCLFSKE